jgi:hypothetical protein
MGFIVKTADDIIIRFDFYLNSAQVTSEAFAATLPFSRTFVHARVSGSEIWTDDAPQLHIIQENASVFVKPGEVVIGPLNPRRAKTSGCMGIYYGEGRGLDACNIFAKVQDDDFNALKKLGEKIWKEGAQRLTFDILVP